MRNLLNRSIPLIWLGVLLISTLSYSGCNKRSPAEPQEIRRVWGKAGEQPPIPAWDWMLLPLEDYVK